MDLAVIILASASLPILGHNAYWLSRDRNVDGYYGVASGIYTFLAAIMVAYGFPGNLIMPVAFGIIGAGGLHAYFSSKGRMKLAKAVIFVSLGIVIYLMGVFL